MLNEGDEQGLCLVGITLQKKKVGWWRGQIIKIECQAQVEPVRSAEKGRKGGQGVRGLPESGGRTLEPKGGRGGSVGVVCGQGAGPA